MLGYRMFGIPVGDGDGWTPLSQGRLMIGRSRWWSIFCIRSKPSGLQREEKDRVFWTASKCGTFSVKSLYSILKLEGSFLFPSDGIWRVRVPPKGSILRLGGFLHASLVESSFLPLWCDLDSIVYSEGNSSWVAWSLWGKVVGVSLVLNPSSLGETITRAAKSVSFDNSSAENTSSDTVNVPIAIRKGIQEALAIPEWKQVVLEEMRALENNEMWQRVDAPRGKNLWVVNGYYYEIQWRWIH
ncbi:hypothetical protein CK203_106332 [Vitis vinifera]|uniref:Uncharacterized protein n=1 Tax=Vitis vinifera TaxID=29760 RepID=A0A438CDS3_VITVI|nr:hypothetical protein CK203_106332 [Vitis vinifera]